MKRDLAGYCLHCNGHQVFVEPGSRAEGHWLGLGYLAAGSADSSPVEPPAVVVAVDEVKPKRRGRKPAVEVAGSGVTGDE